MAQSTETSLPPLAEDGDLPPGICRATLRETLYRFGKGSRQRFAVARRLDQIYRVAVGTGQLARFLVFGSFVTTKWEPADVDVFLLMKDVFDIGRSLLMVGFVLEIFPPGRLGNWCETRLVVIGSNS